MYSLEYIRQKTISHKMKLKQKKYILYNNVNIKTKIQYIFITCIFQIVPQCTQLTVGRIYLFSDSYRVLANPSTNPFPPPTTTISSSSIFNRKSISSSTSSIPTVLSLRCNGGNGAMFFC